MAQITKQQYEAQLQQIFRLLLENKTQEEIAHELNISTRTVARYSQRIDQRYGEIQRQKNDNTLFTECQILKNRMLTLYKALEGTVLSEKTSGIDKAHCAEIAANIAIDVLKMESEGIKAGKELINLEKKKNTSPLNNNNLKRHSSNNNNNNKENDDVYGYDPTTQQQEEYNPNRKF
jgi:hypothetical protein